MKRVIVFIIILTISIFAQNDYEIKSLRVYQEGNETSFPISAFGSKITIEFDIKGEDEPTWEILFLFCNNNWEPYESNLMMDQLWNTERNLWFELLPFKGNNAQYHYKESFPNKNVKFPFSGKWMFFIQDAYNPDNVYASGKFYVVNDVALSLKTDFSKARLEDANPELATFGEVFNLKVTAELPDSLLTERIENVEIIENKKIDYPIIIDKSYDNQYRYYEIDDVHQYSFFVKDLLPGGAYRQVNLMDRAKHSPPETNANFDGIDISHKFKPNGNDFYGGSKLMNYKNDYAEYMNVNFSIRPPENYYNNIFIVGAFTDWIVYPFFELQNNDGLFTTSVELKRGVYDYQYVTADYDRLGYIKNINWIELEGNSWETKREYYIFLVYKTEELGGYDKIIAFKKIWSN